MTSRVAVVIPTYSANDQLCQVALETALGWQRQSDDLILIDDAGYCRALDAIANVYTLSKGNGVAVNQNYGWKLALARGADYVAIMDMDCSWVEGSLREACIPGHVTVPSVIQFPQAVNIGPMFIVPREVSDEYGFLDESVKAYDTDYGVRVFAKMTQVPTLKVNHPGGIVTGVKPWIPIADAGFMQIISLDREIDPMRHKQRMLEDPAYRAHHTP